MPPVIQKEHVCQWRCRRHRRWRHLDKPFVQTKTQTRELLPVLSLGILPVPVVVEVYRQSLISKDYNFGRFTGTGSSQARLDNEHTMMNHHDRW